jgi:hypothetical protein
MKNINKELQITKFNIKIWKYFMFFILGLTFSGTLYNIGYSKISFDIFIGNFIIMGGVITVYLILRFYIKKLEELKK